MQPSVSFVLPAYKREFLAEAIHSILSQTYQNFQLIIVNDASPYNLHEVVSQFNDSRILYYENPQNLGSINLTDSWNHALAYSDTDYVILASDDDVYDSRYLQIMMDLAERYPDCNLLHCRLRFIDENGQFKFYSTPAFEYETCIDFIYQRLFYSRKQTAPEFMFRRLALLSLGGFVSFPIAWYSDDATWTSLSVQGVACAKEALLSFRMSGINLSTSSLRNFEKIEALFQYKEWLSQFLENLQVTTEEDRCRLAHIKLHFSSILNSHLSMYFPNLPTHLFYKSLWSVKKRGDLSWRSMIGLIFRKYI